mmetsp:Transcript_56053/g.148881  ORF Transcript_56053/g.148881 Transcript_56053/m.148881 type:complete len:285 (+) Transcript_56053:78-932(+)
MRSRSSSLSSESCAAALAASDWDLIVLRVIDFRWAPPAGALQVAKPPIFMREVAIASFLILFPAVFSLLRATRALSQSVSLNTARPTQTIFRSSKMGTAKRLITMLIITSPILTVSESVMIPTKTIMTTSRRNEPTTAHANRSLAISKSPVKSFAPRHPAGSCARLSSSVMASVCVHPSSIRDQYSWPSELYRDIGSSWTQLTSRCSPRVLSRSYRTLYRTALLPGSRTRESARTVTNLGKGASMPLVRREMSASLLSQTAKKPTLSSGSRRRRDAGSSSNVPA